MHKILQNHLLCEFVANLKIDAIYALYPESFCDKNLAIRKVFAFSDSGYLVDLLPFSSPRGGRCFFNVILTQWMAWWQRKHSLNVIGIISQCGLLVLYCDKGVVFMVVICNRGSTFHQPFFSLRNLSHTTCVFCHPIFHCKSYRTEITIIYRYFGG